MKEKDLPLLDHLKELRVRLLRSFIGVIVIFLPLIFFSNAIYELASSPLQALMPENSSMIATQVASPFLSPLKLTFYLSLMISLPYFFSEMWRFIAPGLYKNEKRFALGLTLSSILLFYLGILFAYFLVFPLVFGFFTSVTPEGVKVMTDISSYLDFILNIFLAFAIVFEIPVLIFLLIWTGITSPNSLAKKRPYVIVSCFILGMLLTPPDVISQTLLALPAWFLFEVGLLLSRIFIKNSTETREQESD
ncbi:MAG TPA: twin-arginine translocase subunit TatC [Gammaproteobacteria bacterium]|jgi:sec-independent protein translocase protein TatC|nr:twin-arginine translocase subunit TatC [Gammaproteobacteria bacterium]HIO04721.1 twin-arginine translocase subunit TatC [Gammaproteobacteria bacterium]